jgi:hypothetical protein
MYMDKADVMTEINAAVNAAKKIVPDSDAFSIDSQIEAEYQSAASRTWSN